jgi:hypothetical protein
LLPLLFVANAILVAQYLRTQAWWRLDTAGVSALRVARSVVSLLDAAAYLRDVPDEDRDMAMLDVAGCFCGGVFDPGPEGAVVIRDWQLADEQSAGPEELLAALAAAADRTRPGGPTNPAAAFGVSIPSQPAVRTMLAQDTIART